MTSRNLALVLAAALLFAFFIWPGQWKYDKLQDVPMRTHRITGRSQLFIGGGWKSFDEDEKESIPATDTVRMLDPFEQTLVDGLGGVNGVGYFNGSVYNGTACTVNRIVYAVTTRRGADTTRRTFSENEFIGARQTKDVIFKVDVADRNRSFVAWNIDSVQATCPKKK